jgi:hypothetical protein
MLTPEIPFLTLMGSKRNLSHHIGDFALTITCSGGVLDFGAPGYCCARIKEFAYMDMKPSSICFAAGGDLVLIDLGSVAKFGVMSECTNVYLPNDKLNRKVDGIVSNRYSASTKIDSYMLAICILEKFEGLPLSTASFSASDSCALLPSLLAL